MNPSSPLKLHRNPFYAAAIAALLSTLCPIAGICAPATAPADANDYRINVRSSIEQKYTAFSKEAPQDHGRRYAIIAFEQLKTEAPLARPVNKPALYAQVRAILSAYGFHEPPAGTNPDIVISVLYGRSVLSNPYLVKGEGLRTQEYAEAFGGGPVYSPDLFNVMHQKTTPGFAEKAILNQEERLFIAVLAWKFPSSPREKPKQVWRTVMIVDNPDLDLNLVAEKMLAAGGGYFDHQIDKEEVTILTSVAAGHVKVGTPTVVAPKKSR